MKTFDNFSEPSQILDSLSSKPSQVEDILSQLKNTNLEDEEYQAEIRQKLEPVLDFSPEPVNTPKTGSIAAD